MSVRLPLATYRLQLQAGFTFQDAEQLLGYLDRLGISDCYLSPILKAKKGSRHGYDPVDFSQVNPELGGEESFKSLAQCAKKRGMGLLLDIVPNHMCITDPLNRWWWDLLENGRYSSYADYFEIDWDPPKGELKGKVLLPFLERQYGQAIDGQEITLVLQNGLVEIRAPSQSFPLSLRAWKYLLEPVVIRLRESFEEDDPRLIELLSLLYAADTLPSFIEKEPKKMRVWERETEAVKLRLKRVLKSSPEIVEILENEIHRINGKKGDPSSFNDLEKILQSQPYRLSHWRVANDEINYRRFFDINELAGIRTDRTEVFNKVHALVLKFVHAGEVTGLRIDHSDGLRDPEHYFCELQKACGAGSKNIYLIAEKILSGGEKLPPEWPIHGTTGYDFLNLLNGIFVDGKHFEQLRAVYHCFIDMPRQSLFDIIYEAKKFVLLGSMSAELHVLARRLDRISEQHRWSRDFTQEGIRRVLREVIACFPVYRTYIRIAPQRIHPDDRKYLLEAIKRAKRKNPVLNASLFEFSKEVMLLEHPEGLTQEQIEIREQWVLSFQQFTGPVMAKGLEDTAFYRYYPLVSVNEVGANPYAPYISMEAFHQGLKERQEHWPHSLSATSTHDCKRSEDVRARLNVLSEIPAEWNEALLRWREFNRPYKVVLDEEDVPDPNEEYLIYQTLVGTWSIFDENYVNRIVAYMLKAVNESKRHTSWVNPNEEYCHAIEGFVRTILRKDHNPFLDDFLQFLPPIVRAGAYNALAQVLLKITAPGIPDFYQGEEVMNYRLVDPDNRSQVDFASRQKWLGALSEKPENFDVEDSKLKLWIIYRALALRKKYADLFALGTYSHIEVNGEKSSHVIAFARQFNRQIVVTVAARFYTQQNGWDGTDLLLSDGNYREVLSERTVVVQEGRVSLEDLFFAFPMAILESVQ